MPNWFGSLIDLVADLFKSKHKFDFEVSKHHRLVSPLVFYRAQPDRPLAPWVQGTSDPARFGRSQAMFCQWEMQFSKWKPMALGPFGFPPVVGRSTHLSDALSFIWETKIGYQDTFNHPFQQQTELL
jgi:hypothetical protein